MFTKMGKKCVYEITDAIPQALAPPKIEKYVHRSNQNNRLLINFIECASVKFSTIYGDNSMYTSLCR